MNDYKTKRMSSRKIKVPSLSLNEKIDFFTSLYTYVKASIPVSTALSKIIQYSSNPKIKEVSSAMLHSLNKGEDFADIILKFETALGGAYCNLLSVGMQTGELPKITKDILESLKKIRTLKRNLIKACIYPGIQLCIVFIAVMVLLFVIVPKFSGLVEMSNGAGVAVMKILLVISKFILRTWIILIPLTIYAFYLLTKWFKRSIKNETFIKFPILGNIIKKYNISIFSRILALAYAAGVPILSAYTLAAKVVENNFIKNKILKCSQILPGSTLSATIASLNLFEPQMISKLESGEISGNVDEMLLEISNDIDEYLDTIISTILKVLEPILIIIIGILVLIYAFIITGPANPINYL